MSDPAGRATHGPLSRIGRRVRAMRRAPRVETFPRGRFEIDADARRARIELDAIRARFPDHS